MTDHQHLSAGNEDETKTVYVKRWRTLVKLPAKYADEIVAALRVPVEPQAVPVTQQDVAGVIAWAKEHDLPVPLALFAHFKMSRGTSPLSRPQTK
jgi:hypothetical protein